MSTHEVDGRIGAVNRANARILDLYAQWVKARGLNYNQFVVLYALLSRPRLP